jgi:hypothetical protein
LPSVPQTTNFTFGGKKKKKNVCAKFELDWTFPYFEPLMSHT